MKFRSEYTNVVPGGLTISCVITAAFLASYVV